jgi:hypothetical protein
MHKNLVTTFCMDESYNRLDSLKGFQHIVSDSSYGTFFSVYAKMNRESHPDDKRFYKIKDAVFYLQNFSGQVTIGIDSVDPEIDMAYYESIEEPVYFVTINVQALSFQPFYPASNSVLFDEAEDEVLSEGQQLSGFDFTLKDDLSIKNFKYLENLKLKLKDGYLTSGYKIVFHINFKENDAFISKDNLAKSVFLDDKYYARYGEVVISHFEEDLSPLIPKNALSAVHKEKGLVYDSIGRPCKSGIISIL